METLYGMSVVTHQRCPSLCRASLRRANLTATSAAARFQRRTPLTARERTLVQRASQLSSQLGQLELRCRQLQRDNDRLVSRATTTVYAVSRGSDGNTGTDRVPLTLLHSRKISSKFTREPMFNVHACIVCALHKR